MKNSILYKIRLILAGIIFILAILGLYGVFYPVKVFDLQLLPSLQRVIVDFSVTALLIFVLLTAATFVFGRIYCSLICPFGIFQEIIGFIKLKLVKSSRQVNFPLKYFIAAIVWGIFFGGTAFVSRYFDPYSLFGSAQTFAVAGIIGVILVAAAVFIKDSMVFRTLLKLIFAFLNRHVWLCV